MQLARNVAFLAVPCLLLVAAGCAQQSQSAVALERQETTAQQSTPHDLAIQLAAAVKEVEAAQGKVTLLHQSLGKHIAQLVAARQAAPNKIKSATGAKVPAWRKTAPMKPTAPGHQPVMPQAKAKKRDPMVGGSKVRTPAGTTPLPRKTQSQHKQGEQRSDK